MIADINKFGTDIRLNEDEVFKFCKPGCGPETCIWLLMTPLGWECSYYHKPLSLLERFERGETNAKRNGCRKVKNFHPYGKGLGVVEF